MKKVFIGGSRRVSRLNSDVTLRLDRIIEKGLPVLVGDANGADKAVQQYLRNRRYDHVEVFCVEGSCRNNVANWPVRHVPAPNNRKDFSYYEAKDKVMADEASVGFMIWDGKSLGTLMNAFRLLCQRKTVVIYATRGKEFFELKGEADWERFATHLGKELRRRIEARVGLDSRRFPMSNQVGLFSNSKQPA